MEATLSAVSKPRLLRVGVQQAIAASEDELAAAVEFELVSILQGPSFRGSLRSAAFLRFVVEETLAGRHDLLKERTLGVALLGKAPTYDTGADSGVRVRANEVRRRLASHYEAAAPKAGIRIELPPGAYTPKFVPVAARPAPAAPNLSAPPPMRFWQLAAPSLLAIFLALIALRGDVESNDSFSRFWNQVIAGRAEIVIAVDGDGPSSISPALADAAMPFESLASVFQVPVHIVAAAPLAPASRSCVIRMSMRQEPSEPILLRLNGAILFRGYDGVALWLWADSAERLRSAALTLASRSGFPELE
jgi:hypothetical protein